MYNYCVSIIFKMSIKEKESVSNCDQVLTIAIRTNPHGARTMDSVLSSAIVGGEQQACSPESLCCLWVHLVAL
jgi:hypothetical protein